MQKTLFDHTTLCRVLSGPANWILRLAGWRIEGTVPDLPKYVVIAAPHTSNWDFVIMLFAVMATRVPIHWLGKHTLFRKPFGSLFRWLGGIAIDRSKAGNAVAQMVEAFNDNDRFVLAIPPEGSRSQVDRWKSGFYYVAKGANVPLLLASLDYSKKVAGIGKVFYPTDDAEADTERIRAFYATVTGKFPQKKVSM